MERPHRQRKFKNYVIDSRFQTKIGLYFVAVAVAIAGVLGTLILVRVQNLQSKLSGETIDRIFVQEALSNLSVELGLTVFLTTVAFVFITFIYAVVVTHRIAGPVVAICRFIDQLREGQYEQSGHLRQYDDLQPIMDKLNELAASLRSKNSK